MHIELIGCTGAGKTTLARGIVRVARESGIDAQLSDDFVLNGIGLNWVETGFLRRRLVETYALLYYLLLSPRYRDFSRFVRGATRRCPGSAVYRLHIARITLRKIGICETIRRRKRAGQVVLADNEGMLQAIHNLFVHTSASSFAPGVAKYVDLVPLPDVVVYLVQPQSVLIERTLARGHRRIRDLSYDTVREFVRRATEVFDEAIRLPSVASRLLVVDGQQRVIVKPREAVAPFVFEAEQFVRDAITSSSGAATLASPGAGAAHPIEG